MASETPPTACRGCWLPMVSQKEFRRRRPAGFVPNGGFDLCRTDYMRARRHGTLPDPAPARPKGVIGYARVLRSPGRFEVMAGIHQTAEAAAADWVVEGADRIVCELREVRS